MNAHEIVMRSPFRYHTAATFIEADIAAAMQAAVRKEGHVPALPQQNAKVEEHEASRARVAVLIMKMIEEQGHVSYLQIANRILGVSRLFEMGLTIPHVAAVSGHRSWQNLQRYTHIRQTGDRFAGWKVMDRFEGRG